MPGKTFIRRCAGGVLALLLAGCHTLPTPGQRTAAALALAEAGGLSPFQPDAAPLPLRGMARLGCVGQPLHVYIEGDGLAWIDSRTPSPDPTPVNPVALQLAVRDAACNVVYLGRPGQYGGSGVAARYWLGARFSPEVVDSYVAALRGVADARQAPALRLVGYSGGGAVAALVAARLQAEGRAVALVTVAGNLDPGTWARRRKLTPLADSLNPVDVAPVLADVPQLHLSGRRDRQVPGWVLEAYLQRLPRQDCVRVVLVDADHAGPWEEALAGAPTPPRSCSPSLQTPR